MNLETLVTQFHTRTLPRGQWDHRAHLGVALWALQHYEYEAALEYLRREITAYNAHIGVENGPFSGYHETITHFFVLAIRQFLSDNIAFNGDVQWEKLVEIWGDKNAIFHYYSRRNLFYPPHRASFGAPDLRPLDFLAPV